MDAAFATAIASIIATLVAFAFFSMTDLPSRARRPWVAVRLVGDATHASFAKLVLPGFGDSAEDGHSEARALPRLSDDERASIRKATRRIARASVEGRRRPGQRRRCCRRANSAQSPGYYGQTQSVKPPVWTWEIPLYFFFGGMAGMSAVIASGAVIFHHVDPSLATNVGVARRPCGSRP